jgi:eight-cysteine-cluster-containing protein
MRLNRWDKARRWLGRAAAIFSPGVVLGLHPSVAEACSCLPSTVESSYNSSSDVVTLMPLLGYCTANEQHYVALVTDTFKGCSTPGDIVVLTTATDSAACGMELELGDEYLINGAGAGSFLGLPKLSFSLCGHNRPTRDLTDPEQAFLEGCSVCCGDECECADGTLPVRCFVNPCDVAPLCDDAARCEANYCGGCNAEFYDASGYAVCQSQSPEPPGCASDVDCFQTGCSGQVCAAQDVITTCEFREEYACYQDAALTTCGCNASQCGFAATDELAACLEAAGAGTAVGAPP